MSPIASGKTISNEQAIQLENYAHVRNLSLLSDSSFHEGNRIGLEQEKQGLVVPLEQLRAKFGRRR